MTIFLNARANGMAVAVALCVVLSGCNKAEKEPAPEVEVQAQAVATGDITLHVTGDAVLFPLDQAAIVPKVVAPVSKFYVQRGAKVHRGQLLARLENRDVSAAALDASGGYQQALATYRTSTQASVPEDYQKAELDYEQARTNLDVQQKIFDARQELFKQGAIPGRDLDTARLNLVQAQSQFDQANKHLQSAKAVTRDEAIKNAEGQLQSAKGKLHAAEASVSYTEIRSPIDGVVTDRPFYAGETAPAGAALITVMQTATLLAKSHLAQGQAQQLKLGTAADVTVTGVEKPVTGRSSSSVLHSIQGAQRLRCGYAWRTARRTQARDCSAGGDCRRDGAQRPHGGPASSVLKDDTGKTSVMVVEKGAAKKHEVTTGICGWRRHPDRQRSEGR